MDTVKISPELFDTAKTAEQIEAEKNPPQRPAEELDSKKLADRVAGDFPPIDGTDFQSSGTNGGEPVEKDSAGQTFDPTKHKMDSAGKPVKNDDGKFIRRYKKRDGEKTDEDKFDQTGRMLASAVFNFFGAVFDPEEAKPSPEMAEDIRVSYAAALREKNISISDPFWESVALTGIYGFTVIQKPKSNAKFKTIWARVTAKFSKKNPAEVVEFPKENLN